MRSQRILQLAASVPLETSRRLYRWTRAHLALEQRLKRLQTRLGSLPRDDVGLRLDDLDASLSRRLKQKRARDREHVIGEFDQDGLLMSNCGEIAGLPTIGQSDFIRRARFRVLLVDLNGRLGVRKEFGHSLGRFVQELEALSRLGAADCPTPRVMNVDWDSHAITMTFVRGPSIRALLEAAGAPILDRNVVGPYTRSVDRQLLSLGRAAVPRVLSSNDIKRGAAALSTIHAAGFALEDLKFGNIIVDERSRDWTFLDFERALPIGSLPRKLAEYIREVDLRKFRQHFGDPADLPHE